MATWISIVVLLSCGIVSARMAHVRDAPTGEQYTFLIGLVSVMGSCLIVYASYESALTISVIIMMTTAWLSCSVASLNTRINPGTALFFALLFSVIVVIGRIEGTRTVSPLVMASVTMAWLTVGWLIRYDRAHPVWIPLMVIGSPILLISPAY